MVKTRKLPMVKRERMEQRCISFCKRRQGLFSKAAELCKLCNAQVAILVTSPCLKHRIYSFGHSSVDVVLDAFLNGCVPQAVDDDAMRSVVSLSEEIKALEGEISGLMQDKKRRKVVADDESSWGFEKFEKSNSIKELNALVDSLESLIDKGKRKLNESSSPNLLLCLGSTSDTTITSAGISPSSTTPNINNASLTGNTDFNATPLTSFDVGSGFTHNGDNVFPTGDIGGDDLLSPVQSPSGSNYNWTTPNINNASLTGNTDFNATPLTSFDVGSGFTHNGDNVFPPGGIGGDDLLSLLQSPSGSNYNCNNIFPTNISIEDYVGAWCDQAAWDAEFEEVKAEGGNINESICEFGDLNKNVMDGNCNAN